LAARIAVQIQRDEVPVPRTKSEGSTASRRPKRQAPRSGPSRGKPPRASSLLDLVPDELLLIDEHGMVRDCRALEGEASVFVTADPKRRSFAEALPPPLSHWVRDALQRVRARGAKEARELMVTRGRTVRFYDVRALPAPNAEVLIVVRDVTAEKWAEGGRKLLETLAFQIAETDSLSSALAVVLREICGLTAWDLGQAWVRRLDGSALESSPAFHGDAARLEAFREVTRRFSFEVGSGLPGRVWQTKRCVWVKDLIRQGSFPRAPYMEAAGLASGVGVPVLAEGEVVAVLEFFVFEERPEDVRLVDLVSAVAARLGSLIERKRVEAAYRLLDTAVRHMDQPLLITTTELHPCGPQIVFSNAAFSQMTGYAAADVHGRPPDFLYGADTDLEVIARMNRELYAGRPAVGEIATYRSDGAELQVERHVAPVPDAAGVVQHFVSLEADVSERRRQERRRAQLERTVRHANLEWRRTFDAIQSPILILDLGGRILRMNGAARDLTGHGYREVVGRAMASLGPSEPWKTAANLLQAARVQGALNVQVRDGATKRTWDIAVSLFARARSEDERAIVVARDISGMVALQESLSKSETMAAMGTLVAGVAHEVRNPLFGVTATLDAFEARFGTREEYRPHLEVLRSQLGRLSRLMRDLLEYGRANSLELTEGGFAEVLAEAVECVAELGEHRGVRVECAPMANARFAMDRRRLVQVLLNLLDNAVQHSPRGAVVRVRVEEAHLDGHRSLVCRVEDAGPGFRGEDLEHVFEPFFSRRQGGTGLGLSIVQRIIEQHGGTITATNLAGGGALMTVTLPIDGARRAERAPAELSAAGRA
jgi:PAS domain S-box-containing protein